MIGKRNPRMESIKALNEELIRTHRLILEGKKIQYDVDFGQLFINLGKLQHLLMTIAKRYNGLEY